VAGLADVRRRGLEFRARVPCAMDKDIGVAHGCLRGLRVTNNTVAKSKRTGERQSLATDRPWPRSPESNVSWKAVGLDGFGHANQSSQLSSRDPEQKFRRELAARKQTVENFGHAPTRPAALPSRACGLLFRE